MSKYWWTSEAGIRGHYNEEREYEAARHQERIKRLNDEELAALDAFDRNNPANFPRIVAQSSRYDYWEVKPTCFNVTPKGHLPENMAGYASVEAIAKLKNDWPLK